MIVVRITGGLGNQMFQTAFARALQAKGKNVVIQWHGSRAYHRKWELDSTFEQPLSEKIRMTNRSPLLNAAAWFLRKTARKRQSSNIGYQPEFLEATNGYLDGYWQSEKYFADIASTIRKDFRFKPLTGTANLQLQTTISSTPCVSIHVRRGDYLGIPGLGNVCSPEYYRNALAQIENQQPDIIPVVFSDDIPYCRGLFAEHSNAVYCDWNSGSDSWMDMALMSFCKHHIIANSSFSWWGAWLDESKDGTVFAPPHWFAEGARETNPDIIPENWVKVSSV